MLEANTGVTDTGTNADSSSAAPETTHTPTPAPSIEPAQAEASPTNVPVVDENGQPLPPAFQPDWKFKVKDKEYEIDEFLRSGVKDEESYKKVKRLYERSHGLDEVIQSRDQLKAQYEAAQPTVKEYGQIVKSLNEISHHYNNGDLDSFFAKLQIPFDVVFNYVRNKHQQSQLPAEVQHQLESARQAKMEAYNYQQRLQELQESASQTETREKLAYIDNVISSKAGDVAQRFNEANGGNPDAFRNFVIFRAQQISRETGRDATPEEVVDRVREDIARLSGPQAAQATPAQPGQVVKPPVIPNVRAGAQSPVRQSPKSLDELKSMARAFT
jgi:hypothetical protein